MDVIKGFDRIKTITAEFNRLNKEYSFRFAFTTLLFWISFYLHFDRGFQYFKKIKQKEIAKLIESFFPDIIKKYINRPESSQRVDDLKIWVFWAQGKKNMPLVVDKCLKQLEKIEGDKVITITLDNIKDYVDLPVYIYTKLYNKSLSYAHFSDILRNALISKYGGIWYDATCWITSTFPEKFMTYPFFSPKNDTNNTLLAVYAMGSCLKNSVTFSFVRDILYAMAEKNKVWPDYLFQDYIFLYANKNINASREAFKKLPDNNEGRFKLNSLMNKPYNKYIYEELIEKNWIFKLSYKRRYQRFSKGMPTFFNELISNSDEADN